MNIASLRSQLNTATQAYRERGEAYPEQLQQAATALQRIESYTGDINRLSAAHDATLREIATLVQANPWLAERKRGSVFIKGFTYAAWDYGVEVNDSHPDLLIRATANKNLAAIEKYEVARGKLLTAQANIQRIQTYLDSALNDWRTIFKDAA